MDQLFQVSPDTETLVAQDFNKRVKAPSTPPRGVAAVVAVRVAPEETHQRTALAVAVRAGSLRLLELLNSSRVEVAVRVGVAMPHVPESEQRAEEVDQVEVVLAVVTALTARFLPAMVQPTQEVVAVAVHFVMAPTTPAAAVEAEL